MAVRWPYLSKCAIRFTCVIALFSASVHATGIRNECVNILGIFKLYNEWHRLTLEETEKVRELLRKDYPKLPAITAGLRPEDADAHNQAMLTELEGAGAASTGVTREKAARILEEVKTHSVASLERLPHYDPTGRIGFCFGRACAVHWAAMDNHGVPESDIRKIFVSGNLWSRETGGCKFHSATMVRANTPEGWLVIDPVLEVPVSPREWLRLFSSELAREDDNSALLFVTRPTQLVTDPDATLPRMLAHPQIGPYLRDLEKSRPRRP